MVMASRVMSALSKILWISPVYCVWQTEVWGREKCSEWRAPASTSACYSHFWHIQQVIQVDGLIQVECRPHRFVIQTVSERNTENEKSEFWTMYNRHHTSTWDKTKEFLFTVYRNHIPIGSRVGDVIIQSQQRTKLILGINKLKRWKILEPSLWILLKRIFLNTTGWYVSVYLQQFSSVPGLTAKGVKAAADHEQQHNNDHEEPAEDEAEACTPEKQSRSKGR